VGVLAAVCVWDEEEDEGKNSERGKLTITAPRRTDRAKNSEKVGQTSPQALLPTKIDHLASQGSQKYLNRIA